MEMLGRTGLSRRETWKTRERHNRKGKGVASRSFSQDILYVYLLLRSRYRIARLYQNFFCKNYRHFFSFLFYFMDRKILGNLDKQQRNYLFGEENNSSPNFFEILLYIIIFYYI